MQAICLPCRKKQREFVDFLQHSKAQAFHGGRGCSIACTTRVRKTKVQTTPVRSQQCELPTVRKGQQCERDKSANVKCTNVSSAMPHRCEKSRQQCERHQCEWPFSFSKFLILISDLDGTKKKKMTCPARTDLLFEVFFIHTFNTFASMFVYTICMCKRKEGKGSSTCKTDVWCRTGINGGYREPTASRRKKTVAETRALRHHERMSRSQWCEGE